MGYAVALIAGAFLGAMLSAITNSTLVEISLNFGFAFYFGFLFLAIGSIFLYRILVTNRDQLAPGRKCVLASFATLVVVSGFICLLFEHKWFFTMSRAKKVPTYVTLGISGNKPIANQPSFPCHPGHRHKLPTVDAAPQPAMYEHRAVSAPLTCGPSLPLSSTPALVQFSVCFAVTFAIVELANFLWGAIWPDSKAIVESSSQVYLVSAISMLMGMGFGVVFGLVDVGEGVTDILELKVSLAMLFSVVQLLYRLLLLGYPELRGDATHPYTFFACRFYSILQLYVLPVSRLNPSCQRQLQLEETICYPLGGVIGGVGAVMNEFMRGRIADPHYAYEEVATTEDL